MNHGANGRHRTQCDPAPGAAHLPGGVSNGSARALPKKQPGESHGVTMGKCLIDREESFPIRRPVSHVPSSDTLTDQAPESPRGLTSLAVPATLLTLPKQVRESKRRF